MRFRCTLDNEIEGALVINNPDGWKDLRIKLERHPKYHSLVEMIEIPFIFYGTNNEVDGGYGYIKRVLETQGFNATISKQIEISEDEGRTWEDLYEGNLNLEDKEEFSEGDRFYKLKCPITQTGLWSDFINRNAIPVDMLSSTDLNGNDTQIPETIELNLNGQVIDLEYNGNYKNNFYWDSMSLAGINEYGSIDFPFTIKDEIKEKHDIPRASASNPDDLGELFTIDFAGQYQIECQISLSNLLFDSLENPASITGERTDGEIEFYFQKNTETPIKFTSTLRTTNSFGTTPPFPYPDPAQITDYTYSANIFLNVNDTIKIYWKKIYADGSSYWIVSSEGHIEDNTEDLFTGLVDGEIAWGNSYLNITAATIYPDTTTDALFIHDAAKSIVHRITGIPNNSFYSEKLGGTIQGYDFDGCDYKYALMRGLHVRGYSFEDKPFFMSFDDFWEGADPIFNLGCGYEDMPDLADDYPAAYTIGFSLGFES